MGRRGRGVEDFFRGFQAGYKTVGGVLQDAELRKIANTTPEEEALKRAANAEEMQRAQAETQALAAQDAETFGAGANADLATGSGMGNQVRTGTQYRMLGKVFDQAPTQEQQDRARLPAMANVLAKYGDPMSAVRLRREAQQGDMEARRMTLEEGRAQRDTQAHEQRMKAGGMELETGQLNLEKAKSEAEQRAAAQKFEASVGALRAQGAKPGWDDLDRMATEAGMSQQSKADYLSRAYNMDELKTKARAQERAVLIDEAAQKGLDAVVKVYDTHPLFDNGIKGRVVRDKKTGMVSVYDGDALVAQGANDNEVVAMIQQRVRDPIAAVNFEYQMQKVKSGLKKDEADIAQSRASAAASQAHAAARADKKSAADAAVALAREQYQAAGKPFSKATEQAIRTGVVNVFKEEKQGARNEYTTNVGDVAITRTNKSTGAVDVIDPRSGTILSSIPAPGTNGGYAAYVSAYNKAKAAGNQDAMRELTEAARAAGLVR